MKMSKVFEGRFLKAADIEEMGGEVDYTIRKIVVEEVGKTQDEKPVVYFRQGKKGLVLNQVNNARLIGALGDESDDWVGKTITLEVEQVQFGRETVPGIRVRAGRHTAEDRRVPRPAEAARAAQRPLNDPGQRADLDDEIPL